MDSAARPLAAWMARSTRVHPVMVGKPTGPFLCLLLVLYGTPAIGFFSSHGILSSSGSIGSGRGSVKATVARGSRRSSGGLYRRTALDMSGLGTESVVEGDGQHVKHRVLGLGSAGVDFIAVVNSFPAADSKIRTESLEIMGGGNCGNTLVAASRLGLDACLATKVGSDANGNLILRGMQEEGVDVSRVVVSDATPSAFTYVIVDREGFTRTCLHTPQTEDMLPSEISAALLEGVSVVHLDSRHTTAAIALAQLANEMNIPVVVDAEKDRPHFKELLPLADYIICNRSFPQAFTGRSSREEALKHLLSQGRAKLVASTLGAEGCVVITREETPPWSGYNDVSVPAKCPMDVSSSRISCDVGASSTGDLLVVRASSWPVSDNEIVDTTGAGDSFIAAFIYGATNRIGIGRTLALSSLVAARKLCKHGARAGVPTLEQLTKDCPELLAE